MDLSDGLYARPLYDFYVFNLLWFERVPLHSSGTTELFAPPNTVERDFVHRKGLSWSIERITSPWHDYQAPHGFARLSTSEWTSTEIPPVSGVKTSWPMNKWNGAETWVSADGQTGKKIAELGKTKTKKQGIDHQSISEVNEEKKERKNKSKSNAKKNG